MSRKDLGKGLRVQQLKYRPVAVSDPDDISLVFEPLTGVDPLTGERDREYFYNVLADDTALYVSNLKAVFRLDMTELSYELLLDLTDTDETVEFSKTDKNDTWEIVKLSE